MPNLSRQYVLTVPSAAIRGAEPDIEIDDPALENSLEQLLSRYESSAQREEAIVKLWQSLSDAVRDW